MEGAGECICDEVPGVEATMYKMYSEKYKDAMPGKPPIGSTLFYSIAKNITGGGKKQEARAGVDYIKVNFHTVNFAVVDKIIDVLAPLSDADHILRDELHGLRPNVYIFLSYGYACRTCKKGCQGIRGSCRALPSTSKV